MNELLRLPHGAERTRGRSTSHGLTRGFSDPSAFGIGWSGLESAARAVVKQKLPGIRQGLGVRENKNLRRATKQASDIKKAGNFFPRGLGLRPKEICTFRAGKFFSPPSDHKAASLLVANFSLVALYFDGQ